jgi:hypothetical protein
MADRSDQRKARLAAALKDNLKRRKDQARVKAGAASSPAPEPQRSPPARTEATPKTGLKSAPKA